MHGHRVCAQPVASVRVHTRPLVPLAKKVRSPATLVNGATAAMAGPSTIAPPSDVHPLRVGRTAGSDDTWPTVYQSSPFPPRQATTSITAPSACADTEVAPGL